MICREYKDKLTLMINFMGFVALPASIDKVVTGELEVLRGCTRRVPRTQRVTQRPCACVTMARALGVLMISTSP